MSRKVLAVICSMVFMGLLLTGTSFAAKRVVLGSAGQGGTWFVIGSGIANLVSKYNKDIKMTSSSTRGSIENLRLVHSKRIDIAMTQPPADYWAVKGEELYKGKPLPDLRFICGGHLSVQHTVVAADSPIKTLQDLKGKSVAIGVPGSGTRHICGRSVLWSAGLDFKDIKVISLNQSQGADALIEGSADAAHFSGGLPNPGLMNLAMVKKVRILPITDADIARLKKEHPYIAGAIKPVIIKAGTYKGQTKDVQTLGFITAFIGTKDTSNDIVYKFIKTIYEHRNELGKIHKAGYEYTLKALASGCDITPHPAAVKFFKEKGITVKPIIGN